MNIKKRILNGAKIFFIFLALVLLCRAPLIIFAQGREENVFSSAASSLPEVKVEARVDKSLITIGEKITYTIGVDARNNWQVEFPGYIDNLGGFVVRDFGQNPPKKSGKNRYRREVWYALDTYTTGSYVIPSLTFTAKGSQDEEVNLKTSQIFVEVESVVKETEAPEDIRDIKLPLGLKADYRKFIYIGAITFFCLFAILGFWWWKSKHKKKNLPAPSPAHLTALEELERIQTMKLIKEGRYKEYYYLVPMCLRRYLESRFNLKAAEQTTEEFLEAIVKDDMLELEQKSLLGDFLTHCDLVKFARYKPETDEISRMYTMAKEFVEQTKEPAQEEGANRKNKKGK